MVKGTCATCSAEFMGTNRKQIYCTHACRPTGKIPVPCTHCGKPVMKYPGHKYRPFCGLECSRTWRVEDRLRREARNEPPPARSTRSDLRAAYDSGDRPGIIRALQARTKLDSNGCWIWPSPGSYGYGIAKLGRVQIPAHRLALEAQTGKPLGEQACHHKCANRACVNPDHLQPVTHRENMAEMHARNYMERRIRALEDALRSVEPSHSLLEEVGIPSS